MTLSDEANENNSNHDNVENEGGSDQEYVEDGEFYADDEGW